MRSTRPHPAPSPTRATAPPSAPPRRPYPERDFGVGYGRSSGYASDRRYARDWNGSTLFRCG